MGSRRAGIETPEVQNMSSRTLPNIILIVTDQRRQLSVGRSAVRG